MELVVVVINARAARGRCILFVSFRRWRCFAAALHCTVVSVFASVALLGSQCSCCTSFWGELLKARFSQRLPAIFLERLRPFSWLHERGPRCALSRLRELAASKTLGTPESHQIAPFVLAPALRARRRVGSLFEASSRLLDLQAHIHARPGLFMGTASRARRPRPTRRFSWRSPLVWPTCS